MSPGVTSTLNTGGRKYGIYAICHSRRSLLLLVLLRRGLKADESIARTELSTGSGSTARSSTACVTALDSKDKVVRAPETQTIVRLLHRNR